MAERKTDKLTEAAEKTTAVLQGLQSRLNREAGWVRAAQPEIPDELGKQLEEYFAAATSATLDHLRNRVMEGLVEKILRTWQEPSGRLSAAFKDALVERLIDRVLDALHNENAHG
jgi:hypothetical protein